MDLPRHLNPFRVDFEKAVKELEAKYDIKIGIGRISYDDKGFSTKMNVVKVADGNPEKSMDQAMYETHCKEFGLTLNDYGKRVDVGNGYVGKIVSIIPRSYKYPIIIESYAGKQFKTSARSVLKALGR